MLKYFTRVKDYLSELGYHIAEEDEQKELVVINDESKGLSNMIIDCDDPILVIEQVIMDAPKGAKKSDFFKRLLQMNRELIHGAFVLDEAGDKVLFRDTLQLENLDRNELEGSINALSLALAENAEELLNYWEK